MESLSRDGLVEERIGGLLKDGSFNQEFPLDSTMSIKDIFKELVHFFDTCDADTLAELFTYMSEFVDFTVSHEIHILFAALRSVEVPSFFIFNVCQVDYNGWMAFASRTNVFSSVMKATWLRCLLCRSHQSYILQKEAIFDSTDTTALEEFTDHYVEAHFNPVFFLMDLRLTLMFTVMFTVRSLPQRKPVWKIIDK